MAHPYKNIAKSGRESARGRYAEGGRTRDPMGYDLPEIRNVPPMRAQTRGGDSDFLGRNKEALKANYDNEMYQNMANRANARERARERIRKKRESAISEPVEE